MDEKFANFKQFVKLVSKNQEIIEEYQEMSWMKLQALAYVLLLPNRDRLDEIVQEMQKKLDFPDESLPKFRRYIDLFVEFLAGEGDNSGPPEYISALNMAFEERMKLYMQEQEDKNIS
jgi:hypothetical protein